MPVGTLGKLKALFELVMVERPPGLRVTRPLAIPSPDWLSCTVPLIEPVGTGDVSGVGVGVGADVGLLEDGTKDSRLGCGVAVDNGVAVGPGVLVRSRLTSLITCSDSGASAWLAP